MNKHSHFFLPDRFDILTYMTEKPHRSFEEMFASLDEAQREACMVLSASDWQSGVGEDYFQAMGVSKDTVVELVGKGIIQHGEDRQFVREWVKENRTRVETIRAEMQADLLHYKLSEEDRRILNEYDRQNAILNNKQPSEPRYRLITQKFSDFVTSQIDEE